MLIVSSFIGGLFLGYLSVILSFIVIEIVNEGTKNPKGFGVPALFLLSIFGPGLFYFLAVIIDSWPMSVGAAIAFAFGLRPMFSKEQ